MGFSSKPPKIVDGTKEEFGRLNTFLSDIYNHLNGQQSLTGSLSTKKVVVTFRNAGQEQPVEHALGRIPEGFTVISAVTPAIITKTSREPSPARMYLQSDTADVTVTLLFF